MLAFSDNFNGTVIITVVTMRTMQVTINEVIDMIAMGYCLVLAARAVLVSRFMACAMMIGCTPFGVVGADFYHMLLNKRWIGVPRRMVQMSIVNVIDMTFMFDRGVATL